MGLALESKRTEIGTTPPVRMRSISSGATASTRGRILKTFITIGLRGENDTAMVNGQAASIALLQTIVEEQRKTLAAEVNPDVTKVPQVWALYKECSELLRERITCARRCDAAVGRRQLGQRTALADGRRA
jgi:hypothetical protein